MAKEPTGAVDLDKPWEIFGWICVERMVYKN